MLIKASVSRKRIIYNTCYLWEAGNELPIYGNWLWEIWWEVWRERGFSDPSSLGRTYLVWPRSWKVWSSQQWWRDIVCPGRWGSGFAGRKLILPKVKLNSSFVQKEAQRIMRLLRVPTPATRLELSKSTVTADIKHFIYLLSSLLRVKYISLLQISCRKNESL